MTFTPDLLLVDQNLCLEWVVTPDQFKVIQKACSTTMDFYNFENAHEWAKARTERFALEDRLGKNGYYSLNGEFILFERCRYVANDSAVAYETMSGTIFAVFSDGTTKILLPKTRQFGFHHAVIELAATGFTVKDLHRLFNTVSLDVYNEKAKVWKQLGFPALESSFEAFAENFNCVHSLYEAMHSCY